MTRQAARAIYEESGMGPEDVDVIALHDCFRTNELIACEALGLCPVGGAADLVESGGVDYARILGPGDHVVVRDGLSVGARRVRSRS